LRIPWTFEFILNTWSERDDCAAKKAESSFDIEFDCPGRARPLSMSWKLMMARKN
jgi:hypothetical protein